jgi:hypothetical protein
VTRARDGHELQVAAVSGILLYMKMITCLCLNIGLPYQVF